MKTVKILNWTACMLCLLVGIPFSSCNNDGALGTSSETLVGIEVSVDFLATGLLKSDSPSHPLCGNPSVAILYAGQHINAGSLSISNDGENLYVQYITKGGWVLHNTQLYVGSLADAPVNKAGNPKVGNFPYQTTHNPNVTIYEYVIPLEGLGDNFIVAAHADVLLLNESNVVTQQETAWADGTPFVLQGNWATYVIYTKQVCTNCTYIPVEYPFYRSTKNLVGNITVVNDKNYLYVTYNTTGEFTMKATHLYVGSLNNLPKNSLGAPDPGSFPEVVTHNPNVQTYTYIIPLKDLPDCYVIAAQADVCTVVAWGFGGDENSFLSLLGMNAQGWVIRYCTQVCL